MEMRTKALAWLLAAALPGFALNKAEASGFEKNIMWGAREAGTAGIGTPTTMGSKALYFNPAGLVRDEAGHEVSLDVAPNWAQFKGPINYQNEESTSTTSLVAPAALMYGGAVDSQLGWGAGYYVSGGTRASYDDVTFSGTQVGKASTKTELTISEVAAGVGYRVNDDLKVGLAWRGVMGAADLAFVSPYSGASTSTSAFTNLQVNDLKASNFGGFKLGAQYRLGEKTSLGFAYRSEVTLKGDGTYGGKVSATSAVAIDSTTATTEIVFPMAAVLGIQHDYEAWRAMAEYVWTQYSRVNELAFEQELKVGGSSSGVTPKLKLNWQDQHSVRLGGEYMETAWPVRFGYIWTSQVTDAANARATLTPPGMAHTLTLGTGQGFTIWDRPLKFDTAVEYTFVSGSGEGASAGATADASGNVTRAGDYSASTYALHLGVSYAF